MKSKKLSSSKSSPDRNVASHSGLRDWLLSRPELAPIAQQLPESGEPFRFRLQLLKQQGKDTALQQIVNAHSPANQLLSGYQIRKNEIEQNAGRSPRVSEDIWIKAIAMDCEAIAEANRRDPGCIFLDEQILNALWYMTTIACQGIPPFVPEDDDISTVAKAQKWIKTALALPKYGVNQRPAFGTRHLQVAEWLYCEVSVVRSSFRLLTHSNAYGDQNKAEAKLNEIFPDYAGLDKSWREIVLGRRAKSTERLTVSDAVELLMSFVTGYTDERGFRKALKRLRESLSISSEDWKKNLKRRSELANETAQLLVAQALEKQAR